MNLTPDELRLLLRAVDDKLYALATSKLDHETHRSIVKDYLDLEKKLKSVQSR